MVVLQITCGGSFAFILGIAGQKRGRKVSGGQGKYICVDVWLNIPLRRICVVGEWGGSGGGCVYVCGWGWNGGCGCVFLCGSLQVSGVQTPGVETEVSGCGILRISVVQTPVDDSGRW